jgi:hypothetical protein
MGIVFSFIVGTWIMNMGGYWMLALILSVLNLRVLLLESNNKLILIIKLASQ